MLRIRQKRFGEATKALQQAVAGPSSNYLTHYYYAFALSKEGQGGMGSVNSYPAETVKIMRAELKRAIELNPSYTESLVLLAFVDMVAGEELAEAAELFKKVIELSPGRQDLVVELGQLYLRQEKLDLALETLRPIRNAQDPQLQKQAEILVQSIERLQKQAAERTVNREAPAAAGAKGQEPAGNTENQNSTRSESDQILEALRDVKAGELRLQGTFVKLDCDNRGIAYFTIQASDGLHKIRAVVLNRVLFRTFVAVQPDMTCGVRKNPENVVLTYRSSTDPKDVRAKIEGDAVAVELVPKEFKLKR